MKIFQKEVVTVEIPCYDPKTGNTEIIEVDFTRSIKEQNNIKEEKTEEESEIALFFYYGVRK